MSQYVTSDLGLLLLLSGRIPAAQWQVPSAYRKVFGDLAAASARSDVTAARRRVALCQQLFS